jgi:hypothetical protein
MHYQQEHLVQANIRSVGYRLSKNIGSRRLRVTSAFVKKVNRFLFCQLLFP